MSILDNLGNLLDRARTGQASDSDVHATYDQVAEQVPAGTLADGLSHAFKSDTTPPFSQMIGQLFQRSNPAQKSGLLNTILAKLSPADRSQALGPDAASVSGTTVTPEQAEQITPQQAEQIAQHAERKDPSIIDQAAHFYTQHPGLVKTLGTAALTVMLAKMSQGRR